MGLQQAGVEKDSDQQLQTEDQDRLELGKSWGGMLELCEQSLDLQHAFVEESFSSQLYPDAWVFYGVGAYLLWVLSIALVLRFEVL